MASFNNIVRTGNTIEKYRSGFQLIIAVVLSICLFPLALYAILRKRRYDMNTTGIVLNVSEMKCDADCDTHYTYQVNGKTYTGSASGVHAEGTGIQIYYNPKTPSESGLKSEETLSNNVTGHVTFLKHANDLHKGCRRYTVKQNTTTTLRGVKRTTSNDVPKYVCYITYQYKVNGKMYIKTATRDTGTEYKVGNNVDVYYESKNPEHSTFNPDDYRLFGGISSSVVCIVIIGLVVQYFVVSKVKGVGSLMIASRIARGNGIV